MKNNFLKLMLVTQKSFLPVKTYLDFITVCVKTGITSVQLREKNLSEKNLLDFGILLKKHLDSFAIPLIINDSIHLCKKLDAHGVHLGQSDGNILAARKILGPEKIIGLSVNTLSEVNIANNLPIDYMGIGALFPTKNKSDIKTFWKLEDFKSAIISAKYPVIAIGGIHENNAASVIQIGAKGIAAIGAFHESQDPEKTTKNLRNIIERNLTSW